MHNFSWRLNTVLLVTDRSGRLEIGKHIEDWNKIGTRLDLIDVYRTFYFTKQNPLFSSSHEHSPK